MINLIPQAAQMAEDLGMYLHCIALACNPAAWSLSVVALLRNGVDALQETTIP